MQVSNICQSHQNIWGLSLSLDIPTSSPSEWGGRPPSLWPLLLGPGVCWLGSLSHREAVSALLLLMGEMCMSWSQAEVFAEVTGASCMGTFGACSLLRVSEMEHIASWKSQQTHSISQGCGIHSWVINAHLELQDSCGSPQGPDKDFSLANMQTFPLVYPHCKIRHRPQDSASVCLGPDSLLHLAQGFENTTW